MTCGGLKIKENYNVFCVASPHSASNCSNVQNISSGMIEMNRLLEISIVKPFVVG